MNERTFRAEHAHKLEDPERLKWLPPDEVVGVLGVREGMRVVDLGAGTGYFTIPIARAVGPKGRVVAVDVQREMLDFLRAKLDTAQGPVNVDRVLGEATATTLPAESADMLLMANVWHELDDRPAVLAEAGRVLTAGGTLAILDWRPDADPPPGPPASHRISPSDVRKDLRMHGWNASEAVEVGAYHYLILSRQGR